MKEVILKSLDENKAEAIETIDLAGKTDIADYMVIASGMNSRHVSALADKLVDDLKAGRFGNYKIEGDKTLGQWLVIDCFDIIIHIFLPDIREMYKIEDLWSAKPNSL